MKNIKIKWISIELVTAESPNGNDDNKSLALLVDIHKSVGLGVPNASSRHGDSQVTLLEKSGVYYELKISLSFLNKLTNFVRNLISNFGALIVVEIGQYVQVLLSHLFGVLLNSLVWSVVQCHRL